MLMFDLPLLLLLFGHGNFCEEAAFFRPFTCFQSPSSAFTGDVAATTTTTVADAVVVVVVVGCVDFAIS